MQPPACTRLTGPLSERRLLFLLGKGTRNPRDWLWGLLGETGRSDQLCGREGGLPGHAGKCRDGAFMGWASVTPAITGRDPTAVSRRSEPSVPAFLVSLPPDRQTKWQF